MEQSAFSDFPTAATAVLEFLQDRLGFDLWMVTRTVGDDWIVLQVADKSYHVNSGDVFKWSDSFCSRMVTGVGPRVAPSTDDVACYAVAPIRDRVTGPTDRCSARCAPSPPTNSPSGSPRNNP